MKLYYLSPKFFRHAGIFLKIWGKDYRLFKVEKEWF